MQSLVPGRLITLWVSSSDTHSERRLGTDLTVADLKFKLERITGISSGSQLLSLQRTSAGTGHSGVAPRDQPVLAQLDDDYKTLDDYGVQEWMTIRVDTSDPRGKHQAGQFTDLSLVEKFELTDQEYEARSDTVLAFKQRHQLGRFAPSPSSSGSVTSESLQLPKGLVPGARCEVSLSDVLTRRGTVRFVGPTDFGVKDDSVWVGVEWDEPVGKNDGSVEGVRYFETGPKRASFVRPDKVTVGDYPEQDPFADDEEM